MLETDQILPSKNGYVHTVTSADGSFDVWFGPAKPDDVAESNFIKTVEGRDFLVCVRLCGAEIAFLDQTLKPNDVKKAK